MLPLISATAGWTTGIVIGVVLVLVVVALVVPILLLAHAIGKDAQAIDDSLAVSVTHTAALKQLTTTIDYAHVIVDGLKRGRARLGG